MTFFIFISRIYTKMGVFKKETILLKKLNWCIKIKYINRKRKEKKKKKLKKIGFFFTNQKHKPLGSRFW